MTAPQSATKEAGPSASGVRGPPPVLRDGYGRAAATGRRRGSIAIFIN